MSAAPRDPRRSIRGIGTGLLSLQALAVLLTLAPTASQGHVAGWEVAVLGVLATLLVVAAGSQRRPYGRALGTLGELGTIAAGAITWPLYVLGVLFAAMWVWYVRTAVRLGPPPAQ